MPDEPLPDDSSPGWDAMNLATEALYPNQKPLHWGTLIKYRLGGPDPLDGISAYRHDAAPAQPHWHFITYGMSELYAKESDSPAISGWGFEFTFRLARNPGEDQPPMWPLNFLQNLARYVFKSGNIFAPGHYLPLNGPIAVDQATQLHAAMFAEDPELQAIDTPNGKLQFLQLVGVTLDELAAARAWDIRRFLDVVESRHPLLVTDLSRSSILQDKSLAGLVAERTASDGSSTGGTAVPQLAFSPPADTPFALIIGANAVTDLQSLLRGRIPFDRPFTLRSAKATAVFKPADSFSVAHADNTVTLHLPAASARTLADSLRPQRGDYPIPNSPALLRIVPTEIKDPTGKTVVQTIG